MKELVEYVARELVDQPDQVRVATSETPTGIAYELHVAEEDLGKVIGRQGRIANALRALAKAVSAKRKKRCTVEIIS